MNNAIELLEIGDIRQSLTQQINCYTIVKNR